jgi:membrane protein
MTLHSFKLAFTDIVSVTRRAFVEFGKDEMAQRSAGLAYYAVFSMFPLLLLAISLIGFMLAAGVPLALDAQTIVLQAVQQALPQAQNPVEQILLTTRETRGGTGLVGLIVLAWSASNIFTQLRLALNAVWDVSLPQGLGGVLRLRLRALGMALSTGLLLITVTLSDTILELIARYVNRLPLSDTLWLLGRPLLLAAMTVVLFATLYRFVPRTSLSWADVWPGAIVAAVGWELLKRGFVLYTTTLADWTAIYGPIAGFIGLLLWLYLSAQLLLFGAEFSAAYSRMLQEKRVPADLAVAPAADEPGPPPSGVEPTQRTWPPDEPAPALDALDQPQEAFPTLTGADPPVESRRADLARGTAVGLLGAGVAAGLAIVGILATGRRLLIQRDTGEAAERAP